jgi:hypothetical protein
VEHPAHGDEGALLRINVSLIHLVGHDQDVMLMAKFDNLLKVSAAHHLACGVSRVDDNDSTGNKSVFTASVDLFLKSFCVQRPALILVQIVSEKLAVVKSKQSRVERVLGNWNKNTVMRIPNQSLESGSNSLTSSVSQKNVLGVSRNFIALFNKFGYCVSNVGPAF